jgi:uncharacterized protein
MKLLKKILKNCIADWKGEKLMGAEIIDDYNFMGWREKLIKLVEPELEKLDIGHRIDHNLRIYKICKEISKEFKKVNLDALYAASLLHDLGHILSKKNEHSHNSVLVGERLLEKVNFKKEYYPLVKEIISEHDNYVWVKKHTNKKPKSLEARIFQDADRIEAIGAVGIARNCVWAGRHSKKIWDEKVSWKNNLIYGGNVSAIHTLSSGLEMYKNCNTHTGKKIAEKRYLFSKLFIKQLIKEWKS